MKDFGDIGSKPKKRNRIDYRSTILTERFLTMLLKVVSNPDFTKIKKLQNLQQFLESIPIYQFERDPNVYALIVASKCVVRNKLEGATELEDLVEFVNLSLTENFADVKDNMIFPTILSSGETTDKEENLVTFTVDKYIRYEAIFKSKDDLSDILTDIGSGNIANLDDTLDEFEEIINILHDEFRNTKTSSGGLKMFHTTDNVEYGEALKDTYEYVNSPKMVLRTGLKLFNDVLSTRGGFLGGNSYIFYADTNTFKSALLRYIDYWIVKYNSDMFMEEYLRTKKRPTVLFISLEDSSKEDVSRYFSIYTKQDIGSVDNPQAALKIWHDSCGSIIDTCHVNGGDVGVNFATIDSLLKKLDEDGYFPVAIICDSIDLMAPSAEDIRNRVSDETQLLTNRARYLEKWISDKPFPFITAHQLNRSGNAMIMEKKQQGVVDIAKCLGRSMISGAYDIERRVQWSAFIYTEWSKYDNELYLEIHREKCRYKRDLNKDYVVVKLRDGFFIEDDYGQDFDSCRTSIVPQADALTGGAGTLGDRGMSDIRGIIDKPMPEPQTVKDTTNIKEAGPMMSSSTSDVSSTFVPPMYDMTMFALNALRMQMFITPFYGVDDNSEVVMSSDKKYAYVKQSESCACTPFNIAA